MVREVVREVVREEERGGAVVERGVRRRKGGGHTCLSLPSLLPLSPLSRLY